MKPLLYIAPAVSAVLMWAAFPPQSELQSIAVALAPMLAVSRVSRLKAAALSFLAFGFLYFFATLSWMPAIIKNEGPWPLVILGWAGLAFYSALYFAAFGCLSSRMWHSGRIHPVAAVFGEAVLWAGLELLRGNLFTGFAWNFLGAALAPVPQFLAPARLGGVYLVSALVVLLNGVFATLAIDVFRPRPRLARLFSTALPLLAIWGVNTAATSTMPPMQRFEPLRVAMLQRNAPCVFKGPADPREALAAFERLASSTAAGKPDLVILPESAFSEFGPIGSANAAFAARRILAASGAKFLIGGGDETKDGKTFNTAALYTPSGLADTYAKQHLVPFGEYIPFDKTFPALQKLSPLGVSLHPGWPRIFKLDMGNGRTVRVAPLVCYEDTDPALARRAAKMGAQAIVLITNDAWFSNSNEAAAHALQAIPRAIETGLPVLRTGNSGLTTLITARGEVSANPPEIDREGALSEIALVPSEPAQTPYTACGDWPLGAIFLALLAFILFPANGERGTGNPVTSG